MSVHSEWKRWFEVENDSNLFGRGEFGPGGESSLWRYRLDRCWRYADQTTDAVNFLMLNPSTATATKNDPTIAKCWRYAKQWGFKRLIITNLYAYRATYPKKMKAVLKNDRDIAIGQSNDHVIQQAAREAKLTVMAWGQNAEASRSHSTRAVLQEMRVALAFLRWGSSGEPWHPLYLPMNISPTRYVHGMER